MVHVETVASVANVTNVEFHVDAVKLLDLAAYTSGDDEGPAS